MKSGLQLVVWPDKRLTTKAEPLTPEEIQDPEFQETVKSMKEFMLHHDGAGLAGPQVGVMKQVIIIVNPEAVDGSGATALYNPEITSKSNDFIMDWEGCLSFPGVSIKVPRSKEIRLADGTVFLDLQARIVQHEIEHLEGLLFTRYLSNLKRSVVEGKMKKVKKRVEAYRKVGPSMNPEQLKKLLKDK